MLIASLSPPQPVHSPCLMWKNEGRHVKELRRIDFAKNKAVVVPDVAMPSDENTGRLVHFVGKVSVDEDALDLHPGPLNISAPLPKALIIKRTCLLYQKFEQASQEVKNDVIGSGQKLAQNRRSPGREGRGAR